MMLFNPGLSPDFVNRLDNCLFSVIQSIPATSLPIANTPLLQPLLAESLVYPEE